MTLGDSEENSSDASRMPQWRKDEAFAHFMEQAGFKLGEEIFEPPATIKPVEEKLSGESFCNRALGVIFGILLSIVLLSWFLPPEVAFGLTLLATPVVWYVTVGRFSSWHSPRTLAFGAGYLLIMATTFILS